MSAASLFITLLQVLFIGLKLGGVITWSWLWVLSPIWLSVVLAIPVIVIGVIVALTTKE